MGAVVDDHARPLGAAARDGCRRRGRHRRRPAWEWGTTVELDLEDLPPADRYVVWTVAADGRREQAGTWGWTASGHAYVRGASAIQRGDLAQIEVAEADGAVLACFDVASPEATNDRRTARA